MVSKNSSASCPATKAIIAINIIVYLAMCVVSGGQAIQSPTVEMLNAWGANFGPLTLNGEWWRLFTSMFLHIGFVHIAFNMAALWNLGCSTEETFGTRRMLNIYVLSGLGGSCFSMLFNPGITSAGASGAIFGVYGALFAYFFARRKELGKEAFLAGTKSATAFLGLNIFLGVACGFDNFCHLGGLISGFILGSFYLPQPKHIFSRHPVLGTFMAIGAIVGLFQYAKTIPFDFNGKYYVIYSSMLIDDKKYDEGMALLSKRLAKKPDDARALFLTAFVYLKTNQFARALTTLDQVVKLDPENDLAVKWSQSLRSALAKDGHK